MKANVCLCVCMFSKEIQTAGQITMKFGKEVVLKGGKVLGFFGPVPPPPRVRGALRASGVHFGKTFIKQKLLGTPN